jgi:hypothetical protein
MNIVYEVGTCNTDVYENLLALQKELPDLFEEMKDHLLKAPFVSIKGKYFTMQQYYVWEYRFKLKT